MTWASPGFATPRRSGDAPLPSPPPPPSFSPGMMLVPDDPPPPVAPAGTVAAAAADAVAAAHTAAVVTPTQLTRPQTSASLRRWWWPHGLGGGTRNQGPHDAFETSLRATQQRRPHELPLPELKRCTFRRYATPRRWIPRRRCDRPAESFAAPGAPPRTPLVSAPSASAAARAWHSTAARGAQ